MKLITFLKENENTRKIFGQRELKIIEKQVNGINLTQSEKNRLSRDIRKKFRFIREIAKFENEFNLKKSEDIKKIIQETKEIILEDNLKDKIVKIFLFGSVIDNKLTFNSDIDLAVMFDEIEIKDAGKFRIRILGRVNKKADVQVYNILPKKIKNEIGKKGRIIYEKN
ncbi:MAG: nucleotidyltransferase domain-containing protein [Candidatus ainarchaeum sp.]|nr:nucleotidyltransferase domain-containing protein [Candidatus ainarchaeum sp.]